ncbi:putative RecB family exonuclease [Acidothermus cellulolyticus 11B]|uniref:Putative RecB family exonuclease n=1 Tax=Acidothermus cellulolyticus (strain ATCC 43068 / DSM 8971 / 11B) TaxID=351607 RepID=A0LU42_ACIC1|nr:putative RecB family exonuclease [Acidothermus cellulolyticus 11B]
MALSPSRAADFMTCPLLYRLRCIDRLPEPPDPVSVRGTLVHAVLDQLFDLPPAERVLEKALALVSRSWQELCAARPELADLFADPEMPPSSCDDWLASAADLLRRYFTIENPTRIQPTERELLVETQLADGIRLRGFVDRLDVAPTGEVRIVDYKTGVAPPESFEEKALFQLKFYALAWWRVNGVVPALLQLIYLGDGQVLRYAPEEADLLAVERKIRALWAAIDRALRTRHFPPRRSRGCEWCAFRAVCPEFGGTPPEWPDSVVV